MRTRLLVLAAALLLPLGAPADDPSARGFDADPHRFAATLDGDFFVDTAAVPPARSWHTFLVLQWVDGLIPWKSGDQVTGHVVEQRVGALLGGSYSLGFLEVAADIPVYLYQQGNMAPLTDLGVGPPLAQSVASFALGDLRLQAKVPLIAPRGSAFGLSALADVRLPTGDPNAFASDGLMAIPSAVATVRGERWRVDGQVGYLFRSPGQFLQLVVHDALTWGLGGGYDFGPWWQFRSVRAIADLSGQIPRGVTGDTARYSSPISGRLGVRGKLSDHLACELGLGTGLGSAAWGRETFRIFAGVRWETVKSDRDGDGVPDDEDRCPDVPGLRELQGCPDGDRDGDGVPDSQDRCPDVKGPKELEGCPDTDGDGIPDIDDKCPNEPGPVQNDGCPVGGAPVVEIETERLSLKDMINFDTGKATIRPESKRILDEIAAVLKAHAELKRIRVEGHTDNVGGQAYNMDLSERRARSVVEALVPRGIARERLVPAGYGFSKPIASNATAFGRAKNRRVEFTILLENEGDAPKK
ncbi:MAG TPA: OmpA family protein [Anaeromyxobacteraceae bacterium]|nr:OmpA family protein [Anaeromyxobacteraceae bacterium]